jgi:hypothetical protein
MLTKCLMDSEREGSLCRPPPPDLISTPAKEGAAKVLAPPKWAPGCPLSDRLATWRGPSQWVQQQIVRPAGDVNGKFLVVSPDAGMGLDRWCT